jgi:CTP:phosphocholine cytidylyltransferase-like protein
MKTAIIGKTKKNALVLCIVMISGLLSACSFLKKEQIQDKEVLLTKAGFKRKFTSSPENLAYVKTFTQNKVIKLANSPDIISRLNILTENDKVKGGVYYIFADAEDCECFYWGGEEVYSNYQEVLEQQKTFTDN